MIKGLIGQLCALSILCGAAVSISPKGSAGKMMNIACCAILITAVLKPLVGLDYTEYALELAKYRQREAEMIQSGEELNDRLNRLVIESQCETYIMDKAASEGITEIQAEVSAKWSTDGLWVPYSVKFTGNADDKQRAQLTATIEAELGIPDERQQWGDN